MEKINFSVSICVYGKDNPEYFDIALESIINQTFKPTEIVLTIDGAIPETIEKVISKNEAISLKKGIDFKLIRLERNMGHGEARRTCLKNCSYDLIALMDSDDISILDRFEKQISFLKLHPELSVIGGYITEFVSSDNSKDTYHKAGSRIVPESDEDIKFYMKKRCPMNQVTVMFKKADVEEVGGYIDWYCEEDYYLWIRLALAGKRFGNIPEKLVDVRVGDEMYARRGGLRYFRSEAKLQKYMYKNKIISIYRCYYNLLLRFIVQILVPNRLRSFIYILSRKLS